MEVKLNTRMKGIRHDINDVREYLVKVREILVKQCQEAELIVNQILNIDEKCLISTFREISEDLERRDCLVTKLRQELYNWNKSVRQSDISSCSTRKLYSIDEISEHGSISSVRPNFVKVSL